MAVDRIDEKIEEIVERKVEEKLEEKTQDEIEDSVIDKKIEEKIAEKVANRNKREKQNFVEKTQNEGISRRKFLKMLGVGASSLALSSSAAGLTWSKITPSTQGTSDIKSSTVEDGAITSSKLSSSSVTKNKLGFNFDENAQDAVGQGFQSPLTYDDANGEFGFSPGDVDRSNLSGALSPSNISPQGEGSGLDADTVDGKQPSEIVSADAFSYSTTTSDSGGSYTTVQSYNVSDAIALSGYVSA